MQFCIIGSTAMNNILGQPVEGEDFFDREEDTQKLWLTLEEGNHVLLLAPRRVGKTSLAHRVGAEALRFHWKFALVDVQGCRDELAFLDHLFQDLKSAGVRVPVLARLTEWVTYARRELRGKVGAGDFSLEIQSGEGHETSTLEHQIERLFEEIETSEDKILIAVDELPVLLESLEEADADQRRLRGFLNWFRGLRLRYRANVRWLLLGSVGLDTFAELRQLTAAINDLQPSSLGAYDEQTAIAFLQALAVSKDVEMDEPICRLVLEQIGWPLPFFLQLVFHEIYSRLGPPPRRKPAPEDVKHACEGLLSPQFYKHFEPWRGRLSEGLDVDHHKTAVTMLNALCIVPEGLPRTHLASLVQGKFPNKDPDEIARMVATTLGQLERDGYLLKRPAENGGGTTYAFRSFLLRGYWHAREVA
jgi:hypothetical protein